MGLATGTKLGPYEIQSALGSGGMGEVYRARDTRLERTVAIKVLSSHPSESPDLKQRFEREAKAISSLNHPNICTLHDVGSQDGTDFLVMEYLEGETLAERLIHGSLKIDDALKVGLDIAEALDTAHRRGIVHRDLKPGNVMLTKSGAKLMDFGLAKPVLGVPSGEGGGVTPNTPTMSVAALTSPASPLTQKGTIIGTCQYIAPEVVQGGEADVRSDIFSFGCVLYEMVTGRRAFEGKSQLSVLTAILEKEPEPVSKAKPGTPYALEHVIENCLRKEPDLRWHTAHDIGLQLRWLAQSGTRGAGTSKERVVPGRWVWAVAAAIALVALGAGYRLRPEKPAPLLRSNINLPEGVHLDIQNASLALSPDGRRLAFTAVENDGKRQLWLRPLDSQTAQPVAGTEGATYPFWSPDSRYIGFFANHALKKTDDTGGIVQTVCEAQEGRGGTWGSKGMIVFSAGAYSPLYGVSAAGGVPAQLTTLPNPRVSHRLPHFLPDGVHLLFYSTEGAGLKQADGGIYALDVETKQISLVAREESEARYVPPGYILFVRKRNLMAQPFDARRLRTLGEAVPIAEKVLFNPYRYNAEFAASDMGLLVYQTGTSIPPAQLTWFDLGGQKLDTLADPAAFGGIFLSPDDKRMVAIQANASDELELWMYDLARGIPSRFSFGTGGFDNPVWSPDGKNVAFQDNSGNLLVKPADSRSQARTLFSNGNFIMPSIWARDGKTLLYCMQTTEGMDLWALSLTATPQVRQFLVTPANECNGSFSPDGNWLAYISDETGRDELYVVSYPNMGAKRQLSAGGADHPNWVDGGRRLVYVNPERKLMVVDVKQSGRELEFGKPQIMFGGMPLPGLPRNGSGVDAPVYITQDGKRMLLPVAVGGGSTLTLVSNWTAGLNK